MTLISGKSLYKLPFEMDSFLKYNINLSDAEMSNILQSDFWIIRNIDARIFTSVYDPLKFNASTSIFVSKGSWKADVNLTPFHVEGPSVLNVRASQIIMPHWVSDDFQASFIVMSKRFVDDLFLLIRDSNYYVEASRQQVISLPTELVSHFIDFYDRMAEIFNDIENPYAYRAQILTISSFFYQIGNKCYERKHSYSSKLTTRIPDQFLNLLQQNCKRERFLDFYAQKLSITPKHLSRTLKKETGFSAVEWIERYVILEAKVLLKSSTLTIQQIADELNFPDQSFFGKYFKKLVGMSPKEFRNA